MTAGRRAPSGGERKGIIAPLRAEVLWALEVAALTGLAVARPVLDSFGRAPEVFLVHHATRVDVIAFAVAVIVLPVLAVSALAALTRLAGATARSAAHSVVIGLLAGVAVWRIGYDATDLGTAPLLIAALVVGTLAALARQRMPSSATFLRIAGAMASVTFLFQFLVASPSASLMQSPASYAAADGGASGGEDPDSVAMIVLDALPTGMLLDGNGEIDRDLYPNIAALADESTWYRNHTTLSAYTFEAVPTLLSGQAPTTQRRIPDSVRFPDNLFTLFAETHEVDAVEQLTRLCPTSICPGPEGSAVPDLLGEATEWWMDGTSGAFEEGAQILPGALEPDRGDELIDWIEGLDLDRGDRADLWFHHTILPHEPWVLLPDGTRYQGLDDAHPFGLFLHAAWSRTGAEVGIQRQVLQMQAVDAHLGRLFERLRDAGRYDDTTIVLVGDHGQAFSPMDPLRGVDHGNFEQVMWTPFILKAPHQTTGQVSDADVNSADVLPTVAAAAGMPVGWDIDGRVASPADPPGDTKRVVTGTQHRLPAEEDGYISVDGQLGLERLLATDLIPRTGPNAVWQRTEHGDLIARSVDELVMGPAVDGELMVTDLDRLVEQGEVPLLELVAATELEKGTVVAIATNGVIAAVAPVSDALGTLGPDNQIVPPPPGGTALHALLQPDALASHNEIAAYLVEGPPDRPILRRLTLASG